MTASQSNPPWIIEDLLLAESATLGSVSLMHEITLLAQRLPRSGDQEEVWGQFAAPNGQCSVLGNGGPGMDGRVENSRTCQGTGYW